MIISLIVSATLIVLVSSIMGLNGADTISFLIGDES